MKYSKTPHTFDAQADLLISRGLIADKECLIRRLRATSYFRLSGYLHYYREPDSERFKEGTTLEKAWHLYCFDQRLRTLFMDAIEGVEVYVRTQLAYYLAHDTMDPFAYLKQHNFAKLSIEDHKKWMKKLTIQVNRAKKNSREKFVAHYFRKYEEEHLPIWHVIELMDFGTTFTFYNSVSDEARKEIAQQLMIPDKVLTSWLGMLLTLRNRCAHHARLWNWENGTKVKFPNSKKYPQWHNPAPSRNRLDVSLYILRHFLYKINPSSTWHCRVSALFNEFPNVPLSPMRLSRDWQTHKLWDLGA